MNVIPVAPHVARQVLAASLGVISMPYPPSANSLWRAVRGRNIVSERYRQWKGIALAELMLQRPRKVAGPYRMTVVATRPDRRARDLSNLLKALEDTLQSFGVIENDSLAQSIFIRWSDAKPDKDAGVQIMVEAAT